jgi:REP element-mobilizing transposase RayT
MANTYTQIYIHVIFAVQGRQSVISKGHREEVYKHITGVIKGERQKLLAINGMGDHIHILVGLRPDSALSDLVKEIKVASTNLINDKRWVRGRFSWQRGFGAFSYSRSQIPAVAAYIENQERHHSRRSFRAEYLDLLKKFEVEYDQKYLFKFIDDLSSERD